MKKKVTSFVFFIMMLALCANSALGQLVVDSASPDVSFDLYMSEGTTQEFSVVVSGAATPTYTWTVNGIIQERPNSPTFILAPGLDFVQDRFGGDRFGLYCTITADSATEVTSWIVIVEDTNRPPSVGTILLQESPQGRTSRYANLEVYVREGAGSDPDPGDSQLYYTFTWDNGETTVVDGPKSENSSTLDNANYIDEGDEWTCTLRVEDQLGAISVDAVTSGSFYVNTLPITGTPDLYYEFPFTLDDPFSGRTPEIYAIPDNVSDADPEDQFSTQLQYQWYVDDFPVDLANPFSGVLPLNTGLVYPGAKVRVDAIPTDSFDQGLPVPSQSVVIGHLFEIDCSADDGSESTVQFGFFADALAGDDDFDAQGSIYVSVIDTPDPSNAIFYGRQVVPPSNDHIFTLHVYDSGQGLTLNWIDQAFPLGNLYMYEVNARGRVISDQLIDLNQAGSQRLEPGRERLLQVRLTPFNSELELRKLRRGWNLLSPPRTLETVNIAAATGVGGAQYGFRWNTGLGQLETTEEFALLEGCWLHSPFGDGVMQTIGSPATPSVLSLQPGWNLIGVTRQITAPTGPNFRSSFWGWNGSFRIASELMPGEAYWVNVIQAMDISLAP